MIKIIYLNRKNKLFKNQIFKLIINIKRVNDISKK